MIPDSLSDLVNSKGVNDDLALSIRCEFADTYSEFVSVVNDLLDRAASWLRSNANINFDSRNREDGITSQISMILRSHGLNARPTHERGNVDICIEQRSSRNFKIIGEAKILGVHSKYNNDYLLKGMHQLCTRYDTGCKYNHFSIFLIYNFKPKNKTRMSEWLDHFFDNLDEDDFILAGQCNYLGSSQEDRFFTTHRHCDTEEQVFVRHLAIPLHFNPKDR